MRACWVRRWLQPGLSHAWCGRVGELIITRTFIFSQLRYVRFGWMDGMQIPPKERIRRVDSSIILLSRIPATYFRRYIPYLSHLYLGRTGLPTHYFFDRMAIQSSPVQSSLVELFAYGLISKCKSYFSISIH